MVEKEFVSVMNKISTEVKAFEKWLNEIEVALGDGAIQKILDEVNPYLAVEVVAYITKIPEDLLIEGIDNDINWKEFWRERK